MKAEIKPGLLSFTWNHKETRWPSDDDVLLEYDYFMIRWEWPICGKKFETYRAKYDGRPYRLTRIGPLVIQWGEVAELTCND